MTTMVSDFEASMRKREPRAEDLIQGQTGDWEVILGLEVHAQITSKAKLFSGSSTYGLDLVNFFQYL